MATPGIHWQLALDQAGSANVLTLRASIAFAFAILAIALAVLLVGDIQLPAYPQFSTFHAVFVLLVDAMTSVVLFGQLRARRLASYAILGGAYAFNALLMLPFLLSFPGALRAAGGVIGGSQSAIWVWHFWHIAFPLLVIAALLTHIRAGERPLPAGRLGAATFFAVLGALGLAVAVTLVVTVFHDHLPVLIVEQHRSLTPSFYVAGGLALAATGLAMLLAWRLGWQQRTILHLWLAVALTALLADVAASLGASARYTAAWYFGRVESMASAAVLLVVFLGEINALYGRLAATMQDLRTVNASLAEQIRERERLLADLQESRDRVHQLAYYDELTELPNRRLLVDRIEQALAQAKRKGSAIAIMFLDLDHFKRINDTLGHAAGDELLKKVAARLQGCLRQEDTVSRSGGDEFVVLLTDIAHPHDPAVVAQKMIRSINEPVDIEGHRLQVTTSIGIALYPIDGSDDMSELMKKADRAMYAAKAAGRNQYRFHDEMDALPPPTPSLA